jgi:hypothetical protein
MAAPRLGLTAALLTAGLIAGCGSTQRPSTGPATNTAQAQTGTVNTPSASVRNKAAAACKANIASQSKLSASSKQTLEAVCAAAQASNSGSAREQESQACRALVKSSVPPADQAAVLASCPKP